MYCHQIETDPIKIDDALQAQIETTWQHFNEWRSTEEIARLSRYIKEDTEGIALATDVTYKDVVGLRFQGAPTPPPFLVLTAIAIVKTADRRLVLLERDSGDWPNSLEFPGGFVRATHLPIESDDFIRSRIIRDLNISPEGIDTLRYIDDYSYESILEHMLVYEVLLTEEGSKEVAKNPRTHITPEGYTLSNHASHFDIPLHPPTNTIAEQFLDA